MRQCNSYSVTRLCCVVGVVVRGPTPLHGPVLVARAALARHGSVKRRVHVCGGVGARVSGRDRLGYEVLLLPAGLSVHLSQLLMHPHRVEDLAGELDHSR